MLVIRCCSLCVKFDSCIAGRRVARDRIERFARESHAREKETHGPFGPCTAEL